MIDLRNTCILVKTKEENEMILKEAEKQGFHWYSKDNCKPLPGQHFPDILKLYTNKDITYAAYINPDFTFYEASELLGTKEMTVREFIERIADVCRCIEAGSREVERGGMMERLTERYIPNDEKKGIAGIKVFESEKTIPLVKVLSGEYLYPAIEKLATYEDLEEQGLLVRLPCKVGDILFRINKGARNPIIKMKVSRITIISKSYNIKAIEEDRGEVLFSNDVIGIKVFLTREEAEKKLEEMKKNAIQH